MPKRKEGKHTCLQVNIPNSWLPFIHKPEESQRDGYNASARLRRIIALGLAWEARETNSGFIATEGMTPEASASLLQQFVTCDVIPPEVMPVPAGAPLAPPPGPPIPPLPPGYGGGGRGPGGLL